MQPKSTVILTRLNSYLDKEGKTDSKMSCKGWYLISEEGGISHYMKANRYNNLRAKHKFVNHTDEEHRYNWSIFFVTDSGKNLKYDFGQVSIKAQAVKFDISVPYAYSK